MFVFEDAKVGRNVASGDFLFEGLNSLFRNFCPNNLKLIDIELSRQQIQPLVGQVGVTFPRL